MSFKLATTFKPQMKSILIGIYMFNFVSLRIYLYFLPVSVWLANKCVHIWSDGSSMVTSAEWNVRQFTHLLTCDTAVFLMSIYGTSLRGGWHYLCVCSWQLQAYDWPYVGRAYIACSLVMSHSGPACVKH